MLAGVAFVLAAALAVGGSVGSPAAHPCDQSPGRHLALLDANTGEVNESFPDAVGNFASALSDDYRGWFLAGDFSCVGDVHVNGLVHLHLDGTLDVAWHAPVPANPAAITTARLVGRTLYVGGSFGVEAINADTGQRLWLTRTNTNGGSGVLAVAANSERVYVGGAFTKVSGVRHRAFVVLSPRTGRPLRWPALRLTASPRVTMQPSVEALALWPEYGVLFIGGDGIAKIDGKTRQAIGAVDSRTGVLLPWEPPVENGHSLIGDVSTITIAESRVFTAGHDGFGVTDVRTGAADPLMSQDGGYAFAMLGSAVYLAGNCRNSFDEIQGQPRNNLAAVDGFTGRVTDWAPDLAPYVCAEAIAAYPGSVLVAGFFGDSLG